MAKNDIFFIVDAPEAMDEVRQGIDEILQSEQDNRFFAMLNLMNYHTVWIEASFLGKYRDFYKYRQEWRPPRMTIKYVSGRNQGFSTLFITDGISLPSNDNWDFRGLVQAGNDLQILYVGTRDPSEDLTPGIFKLLEFAPVKCLPGYSRQKGDIENWIVEYAKSIEDCG